MLSLDLNYYRDLYTGLVAINNYSSMRAALKALWKSNLGMSRADLIWCFESFNTADGYFDRNQKRKSMLSYIDWITENIVPAQKEVFPEEDGAPVALRCGCWTMNQEAARHAAPCFRSSTVVPTCIGGRSTR